MRRFGTRGRRVFGFAARASVWATSCGFPMATFYGKTAWIILDLKRFRFRIAARKTRDEVARRVCKGVLFFFFERFGGSMGS